MKIRNSFLILLVSMATIIAITAIVGTNLIKDQGSETAFIESPKVKAATEMEVELNQITNSIFAVMEQRPQLSEVDKNLADYQRFRDQYNEFSLDVNEKESLKKLDSLILLYDDITNQLNEVHTKKLDKSLERIIVFDENIRNILIQTLKPDLDPTESQYDVKAQALNEIDINIHEAISASRGYQITQEEYLKEIINEAISELRYYTTQFDQADLAENQRDLFDLLKPDIEQLIVLTEDIIELEDRRLVLLGEFDKIRTSIEVVLDDEIQGTIQTVQENNEEAKIQAATDMELEISQMRNGIFAVMEQRVVIHPLSESIDEYMVD